MVQLDIQLFYLTFGFYFIGFLLFVLYMGIGKSFGHRLGVISLGIGMIFHLAGFLFRWRIAGHIPLSNMFEYMSVMALMAVATLLVVYFRFHQPAVGIFVSPLVFMLMVAAALLPKDASQSLMPALRSVWLYIHVLLAAIGTGCFLVAFATSGLYLIRSLPQNNSYSSVMREYKSVLIWLLGFPVIAALVMMGFGVKPPAPQSYLGFNLHTGVRWGSLFILLGILFLVGSLISLILWNWKVKNKQGGYGGWLFACVVFVFLVGALAAGLLNKWNVLHLTQTLPTQRGDEVRSAWLFFEFLGAGYLLGVIFSPFIVKLAIGIARSRQERLTLSQDLLDAISYRAVVLGYPLYTIGALFAGAIWAEQAWGQFWSWDPKEVGALITWLFFSGYLHARYQRGWSGVKAAILVVVGFLVALTSFFGNYFFGGLHAYV